jgi:competence protein ComEA
MFKKLIAALAMLIATTAFAAVDANKATQAELESIKGIGPVISTLIIDERKKGSFKDWNDMVVRVKGVGDKNAAKFSDAGLTVNGAAFTGAPAKTEASMPSKAASAVKGGAEKAASATKAVASKAASAVKGGAAVVKEDVKEQKDAVKQNVQDAKDKSAEKKAEKAEKKAEKAAAASAAASTAKK